MGCGGSKESVGAAVSKDDKPQTTDNTTSHDISEESKQVNFKPIHSAIRWNKSIEEIEKLLTSIEAVNSQDPNNGNCPIHIAAQNGHFEILQMLINKGANVNAQNNKGNTPIHMAVGYDYYECAMLLIESKADPLMKNDGGFIAKTGIDGDKTLGLAALICAKTSDDVAYAFDLCEENIQEVNKSNFVAAGMKAKKTLGSEWTNELQERFKTLTQKL